MVRGYDIRPMRVMCSDKDGERSVGLGGFHKLLSQDPALGLAVLRGLKEWEHGRKCSEPWGPSRPCKPNQFAHLGGVGGWGVQMRGFGGAWEVGRQGR